MAPYLNERQRKRRAFADKELEAILFQRETNVSVPLHMNGSLDSRVMTNLSVPDTSFCREPSDVDSSNNSLILLTKKNRSFTKGIQRSSSSSEKPATNLASSKDTNTDNSPNMFSKNPFISQLPHYFSDSSNVYTDPQYSSLHSSTNSLDNHINIRNANHAFLMAILARSSNINNTFRFPVDDNVGDATLPSQLFHLSLANALHSNISSTGATISSEAALDLTARNCTQGDTNVIGSNQFYNPVNQFNIIVPSFQTYSKQSTADKFNSLDSVPRGPQILNHVKNCSAFDILDTDHCKTSLMYNSNYRSAFRVVTSTDHSVDGSDVDKQIELYNTSQIEGAHNFMDPNDHKNIAAAKPETDSVIRVKRKFYEENKTLLTKYKNFSSNNHEDSASKKNLITFSVDSIIGSVDPASDGLAKHKIMQ